MSFVLFAILLFWFVISIVFWSSVALSAARWLHNRLRFGRQDDLSAWGETRPLNLGSTGFLVYTYAPHCLGLLSVYLAMGPAQRRPAPFEMLIPDAYDKRFVPCELRETEPRNHLAPTP